MRAPSCPPLSCLGGLVGKIGTDLRSVPVRSVQLGGSLVVVYWN